MQSFLLLVPCLALAVLQAVACGWLDHDNEGRRGHDENMSGSDSLRTPPGEVPVTVYCCGVDYDETYDWRRDTAYGIAEGMLRFYRDAEEIRAIPFGTASEVSPDPDTHHILGGHLYTEYSSSKQTVLKRDGQEFIRFPGREVIRGMLMEGATLYTLWQDRSGEGFCLRKNSTEVFRENDGQVLGGMYDLSSYPTGALYDDGGKLSFSYGKDNRWYLYSGGETSVVNFSSNTSVVYDIRSMGGEICAVSGTKQGRAPILTVGKYSYDLCDPTWKGEGSYRLLEVDGEPSVVGQISIPQYDVYYTGLWNRHGLQKQYPGPEFLYYSLGEDLAFILLGGTYPLCVYTQKGGTQTIQDENYFYSCRCAEYRSGTFFIAVTPCDASLKPYIWENGLVREIDINGFLSCVHVD